MQDCPMIVNDPDTLAQLTEAFERYEQALMANDIPVLDQLFWHSPRALRYGTGEDLYGFDEIAAFRLARPGGSPPRVLRRTLITSFGQDFGTANTEFQRPGGSRLGRQSQSWVRIDGEWRIVAAHVSLIAD
jgi:hypothetical protein